MGENSKIEWTDHTMNFWIGCQEVSAACDHCYARVQNEHWKWVNGWGPHGERRRTAPSTWRKLHKWNSDAKERGVRAKVFSNSLSDFFDNQAHYTWRREAWHYIEQSDWLDFLILTKRPQNIAKMLPDPETGVRPWGAGWPNVWLGMTAENQPEYDQRWHYLSGVPAIVKFISNEPSLGPLSVSGGPYIPDLVIFGGESGPKKRPVDLQWGRDLRDECAALGVCFFGKQDDGVRPLPDDLMIRQMPRGVE